MPSQAFDRLIDDLGLSAEQSQEVATLISLASALAGQDAARQSHRARTLEEINANLARLEEGQVRLSRQYAVVLEAVGRSAASHERSLRQLRRGVTLLLLIALTALFAAAVCWR